jgi:hypothetical protein
LERINVSVRVFMCVLMCVCTSFDVVQVLPYQSRTNVKIVLQDDGK